MSKIRRIIAACGVVLGLMLSTTHGWAGAQDQAAAEALFQDARHLMKEGKFSEACPKLVDSNKLDPAVGTLLYLGECYEKNQQFASAWATFQAAAEAAQKAGQSQRASIASKRSREVETKITKISIKVGATARAPGLVVKRDDVEVGEATWGVGVPVDPGDHVISASAPGKVDWTKTLRVDVGSADVTLEIPSLTDAPAAQATRIAPGQGGAVAPGVTAPTADSGVPPKRGNTQRTLGIVAGSVGVLGLAAGTVFGLEATSKRNQATDGNHCIANAPTQCDQTGVDLRHSGHTYATFANVGFAVGAVGLVSGVVLYFTAPSTQKAPATTARYEHVQVTPVVDARSSSLLVTGSF